jgi:ribonuclease T1
VGRKQDPPPDSSIRQRQQWIKIAIGIGVVLVLVWLNLWLTDRADRPGKEPGARSPASAKTSSDDGRKSAAGKRSRPAADDKSSASDSEDSIAADQDNSRASALVVRNVRIKDESGDVVYRGDIDLAPTLDRIERGERLRFSHDGIVFENREHRLPAKPAGYYHEFVQPTPGEEGPGGQRVVMGSEGEVYYSPDHYRTFRRIR